MAAIETEVLVIGGGATGAGVVRDAAMRGFAAVLVTSDDLATGTTGNFHGLLHSGGRYVVRDPHSARQCIDENRVLKRVAADCIEASGGFYVSVPDDPPEYADEWVAGCGAAGIDIEEIPVAEALRDEPRVHPGIRRAFRTPDASIDPWKTVMGCARSAQAHGARILIRHRVVGLVVEGGAVVGARVLDEVAAEEREIRARFTVNAAGAWAGSVAEMAGCEVTVLAGKGIMIALNHRLVQRVVHRLRMPTDADIMVPIRTVSVLGANDAKVPSPDERPITRAEVDAMLAEGEEMIPGIREARALRAWAGVRPLFAGGKDSGETRTLSRSHTLLDHAERDGVEGFVTIAGGKFTTFRAMAEDVVNALAAKDGAARPCRTAIEPLPDSEDGEPYQVPARLARRERTRMSEQILCECELVTRERLSEAVRRGRATTLDDLRRTLRLAMGPCQGGFCIYRATGVVHEESGLSATRANAILREFLAERWKGVRPILHGDQVRQAVLDDWIFQGLLNVGHLPDAPARAHEPADAAS